MCNMMKFSIVCAIEICQSLILVENRRVVPPYPLTPSYMIALQIMTVFNVIKYTLIRIHREKADSIWIYVIIRRGGINIFYVVE